MVLINVLLILIAGITFLNIILTILIFLSRKKISEKIDTIQSRQKFSEEMVKDYLKNFRDDLNENFRDFREEIQGSFKNLGGMVTNQINFMEENQNRNFEYFSGQLSTQNKNFEDSQKYLRELIKASLEEIETSQDRFTETISKSVRELRELLSNELKDFRQELSKSLLTFGQDMTGNIDKMKVSISEVLEKLRNDNERKLEEMRKTVDEKLNETLEKRLANSFKVVSERLEMVHKGLGEMQSLANGVGDLKKALTNVKNRGIIGEVQLERILDQMLHSGQFEKNVKTRPNSNDVVEFAIKLPGNDEEHPLWLPIDSKFPVEDYYRLVDSFEKGDLTGIQSATKNLETRVKSFAKDINSKYIEVPHTTDFGIMFLPFEGLYSEVLRISGLFETIQRDYKIVIAGPTTMAAFLNSLQMGFKTLKVERSAHQVMNLLGVVKAEFMKFGDVLEKAQKKIKEAGDNIDTLVGARTKKIQKALESVESSPEKLLEEYDTN